MLNKNLTKQELKDHIEWLHKDYGTQLEMLRRQLDEAQDALDAMRGRADAAEAKVEMFLDINNLWNLAGDLQSLVRKADGEHGLTCPRDETCRCVQDSAEALMEIVSL